MTPKHPTKVESARVGMLRMIARGAKAIVQLIGSGLTFCVLFIWYFMFPAVASKSFRRTDITPEEPEQRLDGLTPDQVFAADMDSWYYDESIDHD